MHINLRHVLDVALRHGGVKLRQLFRLWRRCVCFLMCRSPLVGAVDGDLRRSTVLLVGVVLWDVFDKEVAEDAGALLRVAFHCVVVDVCTAEAGFVAIGPFEITVHIDVSKVGHFDGQGETARGEKNTHSNRLQAIYILTSTLSSVTALTMASM